MPQSIAVVSARPDGATSVAAAVATFCSASERTLLIDLNLDRPELAALLDLSETQTVYHLAYASQLAPVAPDELEQAVVWHEGMAVLPGIAGATEAQEIRAHFVTALLAAAGQRFDRVVVDAGRAQSQLPIAGESLLWVVAPSRLGLTAFERCWHRLKAEEAEWLGRVTVVLNQAGDHSLRGVAAFISREYGVEVIGELPHVPAFWQQVELNRSLQALAAQDDKPEAFRRLYGEEAEAFRLALAALAYRMASAAPLALGGRA